MIFRLRFVTVHAAGSWVQRHVSLAVLSPQMVVPAPCGDRPAPPSTSSSHLVCLRDCNGSSNSLENFRFGSPCLHRAFGQCITAQRNHRSEHQQCTVAAIFISLADQISHVFASRESTADVVDPLGHYLNGSLYALASFGKCHHLNLEGARMRPGRGMADGWGVLDITPGVDRRFGGVAGLRDKGARNGADLRICHTCSRGS